MKKYRVGYDIAVEVEVPDDITDTGAIREAAVRERDAGNYYVNNMEIEPIVEPPTSNALVSQQKLVEAMGLVEEVINDKDFIDNWHMIGIDTKKYLKDISAQLSCVAWN